MVIRFASWKQTCAGAWQPVLGSQGWVPCVAEGRELPLCNPSGYEPDTWLCGWLQVFHRCTAPKYPSHQLQAHLRRCVAAGPDVSGLGALRGRGDDVAAGGEGARALGWLLAAGTACLRELGWLLPACVLDVGSLQKGLQSESSRLQACLRAVSRAFLLLTGTAVVQWGAGA